MVSGRQLPLIAVRRPLAVFVGVTALIWWLARRDGVFFVIGIDGPASDAFGPALSAVCAGATVALTMSLVEAAAGRLAGIVAAFVVLMLPSFIPLHRESLSGPPLLALMAFMLAAMVHAPRFSFAYGGAAAAAAAFVSPAALGLPFVAAAWSLLQARRRGKRPWRRVGLALAPAIVAIALVQWLGSDAWSSVATIGWRGGIDAAAGAAGRPIGDQLAPGVGTAGIRWFIVADTTLIVIGLIAVAWRRTVSVMAPDRTARRLFEAAVVMAGGYALGLGVRTLLLVGAPNPGLPEVFPLAVVIAILVVLSTALLWGRWPRIVRASAFALAVGWVGAVVVLT